MEKIFVRIQKIYLLCLYAYKLLVLMSKNILFVNNAFKDIHLKNKDHVK